MIGVIRLIVPCAVLALLPAPAHALEGGETQITTDPADQTAPAISASYVVYTDNRNGNSDIYLYDLTTKSEHNLTPDTPNNQYLEDIDGTSVVYTSVVPGGDTDIYLYDIVSGMSMPLTSGGMNWQPAVSGERVVWVSGTGSTSQIVLADLATWTTKVITAGPADVDTPRIDGDWVVWDELVGSNHQIRAYRVSTGERRTLTTDAADHVQPDVSGTMVVWADSRNGDWDIYAYDLATSALTRLTSEPADQQYPRIDGTRVVWEDRRSGPSQVFLLDLTGGAAEPLAPSPYEQILNAVDGDNVVWTEARYGNSDIFLFTIEEAPPPACGDGACNGAEDCASCPADCGQCPPPPPACGDGACNGAEDCASCPADCGHCPPPPPACGDGACNGAENCASCPADCGQCPPPPPACGDGLCGDDEDCASCPLDCGACPPADACAVGTASLGVLDLVNDARHPLYGWAIFDANPWRRHWVCILNGDDDGTRRASHVIVWQMGRGGTIVSPADFVPHADPPAVVVREFDAWFLSGIIVKLFGPHPPEHVRVDIREE